MKTTFLLIIILLVCVIESRPQTDTLLNYLNDSDIWKRGMALAKIKQDNLTQFIPVLEEKIFEQSEPVMIKDFLETLDVLNASNIVQITYQFIELADDFDNMYPPADPLKMKVIATEILFKKGDYSTVDYVFELAEREYPFNERTRLIVINMLDKIINELPSHENQAKEMLLQALNNSPNAKVRFMSLSFLSQKYGSQLIDLYVTLSQVDSDWFLRLQSIKCLRAYNYQQLNGFLRDRLLSDNQPELREWVGTYLLNWFGEPSDYKYLQDYLPNEQDEATKEGISLALVTFIPQKPASLNCQEMITKLVSYTTEMFTYGWIADAKTRDYYTSTLNLLNSQIERRLYAEACATLNVKLLARIEADLAANKITTEGYKFLHYYCVYIKEEFPGPLPCL
jgi:hypothetical protein